MSDQSAGLSLQDGFDLSGMTMAQLWLRYIAIGGSEILSDLESLVRGVTDVTSYQHNLVAQAINEHFIERNQDHPVAYDHAESDFDATS